MTIFVSVEIGGQTRVIDTIVKFFGENVLSYWTIGNSFVGHIYSLKLRLRMSTIHIAIFVYSCTLAWNT